MKIACFKCLVNGLVTPAQQMHHISFVYGNPTTVPLCRCCHAEITAINCDLSRALGYKELTTKEHCVAWHRFVSTLGFGTQNSHEAWVWSLDRLGVRPMEIDDESTLDVSQIVRMQG